MNSQVTSRSPVFFILGRPRSGTTLLRTLFDAHPNVKIPPEFPVIILFYRKFRHIRQWNDAAIRMFANHLSGFPGFGYRRTSQLQIDPDVFLHDLLNLPRPVSLGDLLLQIHLHSFSAFPKNEVLLAGDKNPIYAVYIPLLLKIYPEARFICLVRDYRDTFLSLRSLKDDPIEAPVLSLQVARWVYVTRRFIRYNQKDPGHFFLVRYEDFVRNPEEGLRELTAFLGIPYEPGVLGFHKEQEGLIRTFSERTVERFHRSLMSPVHQSKVGLWKTAMTEEEIRFAGLIAGRTGEAMGYENPFPGGPIRMRLAAIPMKVYCILLFSLMKASIHLPYGAIRFVALRFTKLAGIYARLKAAPGSHEKV